MYSIVIGRTFHFIPFPVSSTWSGMSHWSISLSYMFMLLNISYIYLLFQIIVIFLTMVDYTDPYDPFNRDRRGPAWSMPVESSPSSPSPNSVWGIVGPLSLGLLGGLVTGISAYRLYRWWKISKFFLLSLGTNLYLLRSS